MDIRFERGLNKNYMIIDTENAKDYTEEILQKIDIPGVLKCQTRLIDNIKQYYYDITGFVSLNTFAERVFTSMEEVVDFFDRLLETVENAGKYLLDENDFIISEDKIFIHTKQHLIKLCYFSGYNKDLKEQITKFTEYMMNNINYAQQNTVAFVHEFYMKCREKESSFTDLKEVVNKFKNNLSNTVSKESLEEYRLDAVNELKSTDIKTYKSDDMKVYSSIPDNILIGAFDDNTNQAANKKLEKISLVSKNEKALKLNSEENNIIKKLSKNYGISQKRENEEEKEFYPLRCYFITAAVFISTVLLGIVLLKTGVLLNRFKSGLDIMKTALMFIVLAAVNILFAAVTYSKKNKKVKMQTYTISEYDEEAPNIVKERTVSQISFDMTESDSIELGKETITLKDYYKNVLEGMPELVPDNNSIYKKIKINTLPFYIGKLEPKNNVSIPSPAVSRYHAKIEKTENGFAICDLNSTNGTFLNGTRIGLNEKKPIKDKDKLMFADVEYIFSCPYDNDVVQ